MAGHLTEPEIPLRPEPSAAWREEHTRLMECAWLTGKTDRQRRMREHWLYIKKHLPELLDSSDAVQFRGPTGIRIKPGYVIDIGPGPGEFLEICRSLGFKILGVDAKSGDGGMGTAYLKASRLMAERQKVPVQYVGFERWVRESAENTTLTHHVNVFNFRGSIEQAFSAYQFGEPHHAHHNCRLLEWRVTARLKEVMGHAFFQMAKMLRTGGHILVCANGSANDADYETLVTDAAREAGLKLAYTDPPLIHKWRKVQ